MASKYLSTTPVDHLCNAAASVVTASLENRRLRIGGLCAAAAGLTETDLAVRRIQLSSVVEGAASLVAQKLAEDNRPAIKAIRDWLRKPIKPHSSAYNAAWNEATAS